MNSHDLTRLRRAERTSRGKSEPESRVTAGQRRKRREELLDAIAGLQSTDEPLGSPQGARIAELEQELQAELRALDDAARGSP